MKKTAILIVSILILFSAHANADLLNRGTDSLGNQLIYDTDLDITWYDFTAPADSWYNIMDWASALTVDYGGTVYDDWRLPATVDGPYSNPFDCKGTETAGFNVTTGEWGHLFYIETGNVAFRDTQCIETNVYKTTETNTGEFLNWQTDNRYWSGTEFGTDPDQAWHFFPDNSSGRQATKDKNEFKLGMAVRNGDIAVVPEPMSYVLFFAGATILFGGNFLRRRRAARQTISG